MSRFYDFEARRRHHFLDETQQELEATLALDPVVAQLGEPLTQALSALNREFFMPNVRSGKLTIPLSHQDTEHVPLVALKQDEELSVDVDALIPTPRQQSIISERLSEWHNPDQAAEGLVLTIDGLVKHMRDRILKHDITLKMGAGNVGTTFIYFAGIDIGGFANWRPAIDTRFMMNGRPAVALAYSRKVPRHATLLHEMIHVSQYISHPITSIKRSEAEDLELSYELEAYHYDVKYGSALYFSDIKKYQGRDYLLRDEKVMLERIRAQWADPKQPFRPNTAIRAALKKSGLEPTANLDFSGYDE